jgi:very-short-patch-repair endonuclease
MGANLEQSMNIDPPHRLAMGRWQPAGLTEGFSMRPDKPAISITRARRFRKEMSLPEVLLWRFLKGSPSGHKFRKQHPAGPSNLDFFCARANLAIEIDGFAHDTGDRPQRDIRRNLWLQEHRIDTLRIPATDVLKDTHGIAEAIIATVKERISSFGKTPPSLLRDATSPSQVDGKDDKDVI